MNNIDNLPKTSDEIYGGLNDKNIISDLRIISEDSEKIVFGVKRSHFRIRIPRRVTPDIAYLAGIISGDGNFYICKFHNRIYPRIRLRITSGDISQLIMLNDIFISTFGAGGKIHKHKGKNCYDLHNNHRVIWLYFKNILLLDKNRLAVPKEISNPRLFKYFLAGFFDTDGYLNKKGYFGTMMSAKNFGFINELVFLAKKFYSFDFSPVKINELHANGKIFMRAYTNLKKGQTRMFLEQIPLRNKKYGPARN